MSAAGLAFYFVFGGNLLLEWGLSGYKSEKPERSIYNAVLLITITVGSTVVNGAILRMVLMPLGLESLLPVVFSIILFSLYTIVDLFSRLQGKSGMTLTDSSDTLFPLSLVLYAAAMSAARVVGSPLLLFLGGVTAASGYLAASVVLDDIVRRLDLEPVPEAFRGSPIRFMSAGLIALVFSGIEAAFLLKIT